MLSRRPSFIQIVGVTFAVVELALLAVVALSMPPPSSEAELEAPYTDRITVYTALREDVATNALADFQAQYPETKVNLVRDSTGIITDRLLAERDNPRADVIWGLAVTSLLPEEWRSRLKGYAPAGLERIDPRLYDTATPPYWVGITVYASAFCINTEELARLELPMPHSWQDLLDPVYRGHLVMPSPTTSGTGYVMVTAILQIYDEIEGWDYLDALHANIARYTRSGSDPCQLAGAGEYAIGLSSGYQGTTQRAQGKPIVVIAPQEGVGWDMSANALVKKYPIKPAAYAFLDWAISDSAVTHYAADWALITVPTGQPLPEGYPSDLIGLLLDKDLPWAAANRHRILKEWLSRYGDSLAPPEAE